MINTGMISSPGVGSGLDVNTIVTKLMQVERQPLVNLQNRQSSYQSQLSAYGQLKSALSTFQTAVQGLSDLTKFQVFKADSSNATAYTGSADSTASAGTYNITVNTLAAADKWASAALVDPSTGSPVASETSGGIGTGTLSISVGGKSFQVTVDSTNNTVAGIRDAINNAASNTGVTATVINDTAGSHLVLTSNTTGAANTVAVSVTDTGDGNNTDASGLSQLATNNLTNKTAASDASLTVDGFAVTSSSNTVTGAISGVTINLLQAGGATGTLTVSQDSASVQKSAQSLVDAYNKLKSTMDSMSGANGALSNDSTLVSIVNRIRGVLNTPATGINSTYTYLSEVGISTQQDGTLALNSTTFDKALKTDFSGVSQLFANSSQGVVSRLNTLVNNMLNPGGLIDSRTTGLNSQISNLQSRIDQTSARMDLIEQNYRNQFTALDSLIGKMNVTSNYLSQQLSSLPKIG